MEGPGGQDKTFAPSMDGLVPWGFKGVTRSQSPVNGTDRDP